MGYLKGLQVEKPSQLVSDLIDFWQEILSKKSEYEFGAKPLEKYIQSTLRLARELNPQYSIEGSESIWILKPVGLSRGRGIACFNS